MTRILGSARLAIILAAFIAGSAYYIGHAPTPQTATASPIGGLEPRAGMDLWRSGAPDGAGSPVATAGPPSVRPALAGTAGAPQSKRKATPSPKASRAPRASVATTVPGPRPVPQPVGTGALSGTMSWYCLPGRSACTVGYAANDCGGSTPRCYGAAGPLLRAALGNWRGRTVIVSTGRASVAVRLIDWCSCPGGRVLDGYASVWGGLGVPLSAGVVDVTVSW